MIVVKIKGGLGNQMFQYAMARKLQMGLGIDRIGFDISRVNADLQRQFSLNHFRLCDSEGVMEEGSLRNVTRIQEDLTKRLVSYLVAGRPEELAAAREKKLEPLFGLLGVVQKDHYAGAESSAFLKAHKNIFMNGWFQNAKIAESIRDVLLKEFEPAREMTEEVKSRAEEMESAESVCVHIRRGDYVNHPQFGVCTDEYYFRAMEGIAQKTAHPVFYIFSDGLDEVKSMQFSYPVIYDDGNHDNYESLYLMSKCKHFIMSNSTFSWWGQFLSRNDGKIVMAPKRWCNDGHGQHKELYMQQWMLLSV